MAPMGMFEKDELDQGLTREKKKQAVLLYCLQYNYVHMMFRDVLRTFICHRKVNILR
jgi:hypothetical protein